MRANLLRKSGRLHLHPTFFGVGAKAPSIQCALSQTVQNPHSSELSRRRRGLYHRPSNQQGDGSRQSHQRYQPSWPGVLFEPRPILGCAGIVLCVVVGWLQYPCQSLPCVLKVGRSVS